MAIPTKSPNQKISRTSQNIPAAKCSDLRARPARRDGIGQVAYLGAISQLEPNRGDCNHVRSRPTLSTTKSMNARTFAAG